jgi:hypothetical protein
VLTSLALRFPGVLLSWRTQDFMMFVSAASKSHELLALIPLDLLNDVRSLYGLVSKRRGVLDRQVRCGRWGANRDAFTFALNWQRATAARVRRSSRRSCHTSAWTGPTRT